MKSIIKDTPREKIHHWLLQHIMTYYCPNCGRYAGCGCDYCGDDQMKKPYYLRQIWDAPNDYIKCPYCAYETVVDVLEDFSTKNYMHPIQAAIKRYWLLGKTYLQGVRYERKES
jgi:hypothetical protein